MFFLVPYKVQILRISNDALRSHHNFLNPESCMIGKGSDSVISFLNHYFEIWFGREKGDFTCRQLRWTE
jgi:hypothetical protein